MKRNYFNAGILCFGVLFATACKEEDPVLLDSGKKNPKKQELRDENQSLNFRALYSSHHTMGVDEASMYAENAASMFFADDRGLRSSAPRKVSEVRVVRSEKSALRSSNALPDTMAYMFNFADSAGYAIICADDRVGCPVLACVDNGAIGDETDNPGLAIFLEGAEDYMASKIEKFEREKDSLLVVADSVSLIGITPLRSTKTYVGSYSLLIGEKSVGPLLKTKWGQSRPYNDFMPNCESSVGNMPCGCWATAIGQFLVNQKPYSIGGSVYDWNAMERKPSAKDLPYATQRSVASLMYAVGVGVEMDYGCKGSGAYDGKALAYLRTLGYKTSTNDYSFERMTTYLEGKKTPVFITGYAKKKTKKSGIFGLVRTTVYSDGHVWLADGYKCLVSLYETYKVSLYDDGSASSKITSSKCEYQNRFLHFDWGWDGIGNGYFSEECYDASMCSALDSGSLPIADSDVDFKYKTKIHTVWK